MRVRRPAGGFWTFHSGFGDRMPCWSAQLKARLRAMTAFRFPPFYGLASSQRVTWIGYNSAATSRPYRLQKDWRKCLYQT